MSNKYNIQRAPIEDLIRGETTIQVSDSAVGVIIAYLEQLAPTIRKESVKSAELNHRKTIMIKDISHAFSFLQIEMDSESESDRIPFAQIKRMLAGDHNKNISSHAVEALRNALENHIRRIQLNSLQLCAEQGRKRINDVIIQEAIKKIQEPAIIQTQLPETHIDTPTVVEPVNTQIIHEEDSEEETQKEELAIAQQTQDYTTFFSDSHTLILHNILDHLVSHSRLQSIVTNHDLDFDLTGTKTALITNLMGSGISIVYFLRELKMKDIRGLIQILKIKKSGNKTDVIARILNNVTFSDYDIAHDDIVLLLQGEEFLRQREMNKRQEEIITSRVKNYSGSIKLEILTILQEFNYKASEEDIKTKYSALGRKEVSFYGVMGGLLRDGIVFVDPYQENTQYYVPEEIIPQVEVALDYIQKQRAELEGIVNELPTSALILLHITCSYGDAVNILHIREQYEQYYRARSTWNKARQLLKERNLLEENFDEEADITVIYSPRAICPILTGLLSQKKMQMLQAQQEQFTQESQQTEEKHIDISQFSQGTQEILYLILKSGGSIEKELLRNAVTTPPGVAYSNGSFLRFLRILKKENLISEEKDEQVKTPFIYSQIEDPAAIIEQIEISLFDFDIEKEFEKLSKSALGLLKILTDAGGSMLLKDLKKSYTKYYSYTTYYKNFHTLDKLWLTEGITHTGEYITGLPDLLISDCENYFTLNPVELLEKEAKEQQIEDYLNTNYLLKNLRRISKNYLVSQDQSDISLMKELLYDLNIPLIPFAAQIIPKPELVATCKAHTLPFSGSKKALIQRIIEAKIFSIPSDLVLEGELAPKQPPAEVKNGRLEVKPSKPTPEMAQEFLLDKDLIFEAILRTTGKGVLRDLAQEYKVAKSGSKLTVLENIFFKSDRPYEDIISQLVQTETLNYMSSQLEKATMALEDVVQIPSLKGFGFPRKNIHLSFGEVFGVVSKKDLWLLAKKAEQKSSGNKLKILENLEKATQIYPVLVDLLLEINPEWPNLIQSKLNVVLPRKSPSDSIRSLMEPSDLSHTQTPISPIEPENKPSLMEQHPITFFSQNIEGFIQLIQETYSASEIEEGLEVINFPSIQAISQLNDLTEILEDGPKNHIKQMIRKLNLSVDFGTVIKRKDLLRVLFSHFKLETSLLESQAIGAISQRLANVNLQNRTELRHGLSYFARGNVKEGLKNIKTGKKVILNQFTQNELTGSSIKGIFFEAATYQSIKYLVNPKEKGSGITKIHPYANFTNYQDKDEGADGRIEVQLLKEESLRSFFCLYDCKARKNPFSPNKGFPKFISDLDLEVKESIRQGMDRNWQFFIVFSSKFAVNISTLKNKIKRLNYSPPKTLILWEASALRSLIRFIMDYSRESMIKFIDWNSIFDYSELVVMVDDQLIKKLTRKAKKKFDRENY
jgi:histone H3/H4